jgi:integrase
LAAPPAGGREVEITIYLRDELLAHVMDRQARGLPLAPSDHLFGTATGRRRDPDRLARAAERATAIRQEQGLPPLPAITPHSLRRTWATFAAMIGRDPKWIAAQIGHTSTSPSFTFSVYQQVATRRFIDEQAVWTLMRFADEPAERALSRQITRGDSADARGSLRVEKGEFDRALERLADAGEDEDRDE